MNREVKRYKTIANKSAPAVFVIFCLFVLGWSLLRVDAAWNHLAAQSVADAIHAAGRAEPAEIEMALSYNGHALRRFGGNPDYLDLRGHLLEMKAGLPGSLGSTRRQLLENAAGNYRRSIAVRPLWPYGWANLLSVKDKLGQVDLEFRSALRRAGETGPWEPRVQLQLLRSGLRHWDKLLNAERVLLRDSMADALKVQPREAFAIARYFNRPDLVCFRHAGQPQINRWCGQVLDAG